MSVHKCRDGRLGYCLDHPRWNVSRADLEDQDPRPWGAYGPWLVGGVEDFVTYDEAIQYATEQARAAIQDGAA